MASLGLALFSLAASVTVRGDTEVAADLEQRWISAASKLPASSWLRVRTNCLCPVAPPPVADEPWQSGAEVKLGSGIWCFCQGEWHDYGATCDKDWHQSWSDKDWSDWHWGRWQQTWSDNRWNDESQQTRSDQDWHWGHWQQTWSDNRRRWNDESQQTWSDKDWSDWNANRRYDNRWHDDHDKTDKSYVDYWQESYRKNFLVYGTAQQLIAQASWTLSSWLTCFFSFCCVMIVTALTPWKRRWRRWRARRPFEEANDAEMEQSFGTTPGGAHRHSDRCYWLAKTEWQDNGKAPGKAEQVVRLQDRDGPPWTRYRASAHPLDTACSLISGRANHIRWFTPHLEVVLNAEDRSEDESNVSDNGTAEAFDNGAVVYNAIGRATSPIDSDDNVLEDKKPMLC